MLKKKIIFEILEWIENNLEQHFTIDDIAAKSGYSRRNIQLLFKEIVRLPLGTYVRKRKLCKAATLVRLTTMSMMDIAINLNFDSQQSFSREFKKLFGCTPREYRNRDYWDLSELCPSWLTSEDALPECKLVELNTMKLVGNTYSYEVLIYGDTPDEELLHRRNLLSRFMKTWKQDVLCMFTYSPSLKNEHAISINVSAGVKDAVNKKPVSSEDFVTESGLYACFHYEGSWDDYSGMSKRLYFEALPEEQLVRTDGHDMIIFSHSETRLEEKENWVVCDFYIPVRKLASKK